MLKCYVEGRNLIDGVEKQFNIAEGAVFTENYNETLDNGTIILPQLSEEIEIEPYDVVVIFSTADSKVKIKNKRMCVDTYVCTQTSLDPAIYKYEITLFSETKLLEGILLPSLAITKLQSNSRSVYYYLNEYLNEYGPKLNSSEEEGAYNNKYWFADRLISRFNAIECPEMQWNEPNLREVFNDLLMVNNCIVVLKGGAIDYLDISQTGTEITEEQRKCINFVRKSQSSQDYVSEIKTRIVNSVGEDEVTRVCENITFRNDNDYMITTENVIAQTTFPIYKLKRVVMHYFCGAIVAKTPNIASADIYTDIPIVLYTEDGGDDNLILEFGEWQTKEIYYGGWSGETGPSSQYQNTCLYYARGERGIYNFNSKQQSQRLWITDQTSVLDLLTGRYTQAQIDHILTYVYANFIRIYPEYSPPEYTLNVMHWDDVDWKTCNFEIEYETLGEYTLNVSKCSNLVRNKRQVVDNQTNSYVNARSFGILEYMKANRLGNKLKLINARYKNDENDMPQLAQTIDGSIIFKKEISVYDNFIKANYQATENYVLRDYFTGIKSKLRSWRIVSGSDALLRCDNIKFYINSNIQSINNNVYKLPVYSTLQEYMNRFNYCIIAFIARNSSGNIVYYPERTEMLYKGKNYGIDGYMLEFQKNIVGNSILFSIRMLDNAIVGKYVSDTEHDIGDGVKSMTQQNCKYVNENGENLGGVIYFFENYDISQLSIYDTYEGNKNEINNQICATMNELHQLMPGVALSGDYAGLSGQVARIPFSFRKDNREITQITIQFEMNEFANDIFLGKK